MRRVASAQASQVLTDTRIYNARVRLIYAQWRMLWASRRRIVEYTACPALSMEKCYALDTKTPAEGAANANHDNPLLP
jgi:hypothetical protein